MSETDGSTLQRVRKHAKRTSIWGSTLSAGDLVERCQKDFEAVRRSIEQGEQPELEHVLDVGAAAITAAQRVGVGLDKPVYEAQQREPGTWKDAALSDWLAQVQQRVAALDQDAPDVRTLTEIAVLADQLADMLEPA